MTRSRPRAARAVVATATLSAVFTLAIVPAASAQPLPPLSEYDDQDVILYEINFGQEADGLYPVGTSIGAWDVRELGDPGYAPSPLAIDQATYGPGVNMGYPQLQSVITTGQPLVDGDGNEKRLARVSITFTNVPFGESYCAEIGGRANVAPPGYTQEDMETRITVLHPESGYDLSQRIETSDPVTNEFSGTLNVGISEVYSGSTPGVMTLNVEAQGIGAAGVPGILQYLRLTTCGADSSYAPLGSDPLPVSIVSPTVALPAAIGLASLLTLGLAFVGVRHLRPIRRTL